MFKINPFSFINNEKLQNKIKKLKKDNPTLTTAELAQILIRSQAYKCTALGFIVALPAVVPGVGTAFVLLGGVLVDITLLGYLLAQLILGIAILYNRNLDAKNTLREAAWVLALAIGSDAAGRGISKAVVANMSAGAYVNLIRRLFLLLGTKVTRKSILSRVIPFLGAIIAGAVNHAAARLIGSRALKYYQNNHADNWDGATIDAEYSVEK